MEMVPNEVGYRLNTIRVPLIGRSSTMQNGHHGEEGLTQKDEILQRNCKILINHSLFRGQNGGSKCLFTEKIAKTTFLLFRAKTKKLLNINCFL